MKATQYIPKGFYGTKLYIEEHRLVLVISYDDIDEEEVERFCRADIGITFKQFGLVTIFLFDFQQYLVDAPFNLFETQENWKNWEKAEVFADVLICDSVSGSVLGKREIKLPTCFTESWLQLVEESYKIEGSNYRIDRYQQQMSELYDNHTIDELYEKDSKKIVVCDICA